MNTLNAVILDIDGVLEEVKHESHRLAFNRAFYDNGLEWFWDKALYQNLLSIKDERQRLAYYLNNFHLQCAAEGVPDAIVDRLYADKLAHYASLVKQGALPSRPGLIRFLQGMAQSALPVIFVTERTRSEINLLIQQLLGRETTNKMVHCEELDNADIATNVYQRCLGRLELTPQDGLLISDSISRLPNALSIKLPVIALINETTQDAAYAGALSVIDHFGEPALPCQAVSGTPISAPIISLDTLKELHGKAIAG
ncbi:Hypothetical protein CbbY [Methylophaga frappieri]|uniref:HAD family hydrolase n=1 Tax=Methylophaga frappieri (strain ATCC BAA-2434 / DSM 25690 / JAM7) TaxID=754477 RepID=I1YE91_METFJ|nr:hypothetical protein [Methylophaga frappieri]AFJ01234.1 Hypothetical protein CbbY [Methylophaga frappieri]